MDVATQFVLGQSSEMEWNEISGDFEPDGSYRDILINEVTLVEWQAVIDAVRKNMPSFEYYAGSKLAEMPQDISRLFNLGPDEDRSDLYLDFGNGRIKCHFFSEDQIEFDIDPRDMNAGSLPSLINFMTLLGTVVEKPVSLTHEAMPDAEILRYMPATGRVDYVGPAFG
ncbi:hypothetical protein ACFCW2_10265 [Qipengyuania sp. DSG2-2]|uniref:hypothetical protein n=1 Tax=Qipengyuania sp. DGS2-2 TaxID=3349631 RepID=UPI0036D25B7B